MNKTFGVIGGDRRQSELAALLAADGNSVYTYGLDAWKPVGMGTLDRAAAADVVILPLPLCRGDGVLNCEERPMPTIDLFRRLRPGQLILAGQVKPQQHQEAAACGLTLEDYFLREELTVANAAATAEAAVQVAMDHLDRTLLGLDCLVLGFGRIGRLLSHRLHGLGARVTATARRPEDLAMDQGLRPPGPGDRRAGREFVSLWRGFQHHPLHCSGCAAAGAASEGLPVRGAGLRAGHRSGGGGEAGPAQSLGQIPAGADGAPHRGGGHPGCGIPHLIGKTR